MLCSILGSSCLFWKCRHRKSCSDADLSPSPVFNWGIKSATCGWTQRAAGMLGASGWPNSGSRVCARIVLLCFGIKGRGFHVLFSLCFLRSVLATSSPFNLSRDYLGRETVEHFVLQLRRMNAVTFYGELIDWLLSNVTDENMFLIQSFATCCSLGWCVRPCA